MQTLRRKFSTLWPSAAGREGGDGASQDTQQREGGVEFQDMVEANTAGNRWNTAVVGAGIGRHHDRGSDSTRAVVTETKSENDDDGSVTAARVLKLAHPWGSTNAGPPANWSSQHHSLTATTFTTKRQRGLRRPPRQSENDAHSTIKAFGGNASPAVTQTITTLTTLSSPSSLAEEWYRERERASTKRQRGGGDEDEYSSALVATGYRENFAQEQTHRHYNGEYLADKQQQQYNPNPSRRRRTCPGDSAFVSPMKRSASLATDGEANVRQAQREESDDEAESEPHGRSFPPSHLIFRTGFFKALTSRRRRGNEKGEATTAMATTASTSSKGGGKRRSSSRFGRRTREFHALIVRHAFQTAHRSDDAAQEEEARVTVEAAVAAAAARRSGIERDTVWERVNRNELEQEEEAEKRAEARRKRLQNLRAGNVAALGEARSALARLLSAAGNALDEREGADMVTLRAIFTGTSPQAAGVKDPELARLQQEYEELENLLSTIKEAHANEKTDELARLLSIPSAKRLQTQGVFTAASEAHRIRQSVIEKAAAERSAAEARAAASAAEARAAAQAKHDADKAAAKARAQAEKDRAQAEKATLEARGKFVAQAEALMVVVEGHRIATSQILESSDPGVKKIRMAFKKSYQGCLNKLASTPDTVKHVVNIVHDRAQSPLEEAKKAGWGDQAKEFLYVNLADKSALSGPRSGKTNASIGKLVGYSEGDQFDAANYEMAFPLACVAVDLMTQHPGLSDLFLGTLYSRCPSAIPLLSFDTVGKSDMEVMRLFGMNEGEDVRGFVGRTKGLVVLMGAVMQTPAASGRAGAHPLPLSEGWRWLARFVNGLSEYVGKGRPPPLPTGPVLEWFFKVAGYEMQSRYGSAVDKIVQTIKKEVLPNLVPKSRVPHLLDVVIQDYENRGRRFVAPAGREKNFKHFRPWGET